MKTNRSIGTAKAANTTMSASIEAEEGKNMDMEAITHGFVLLIIHLQKLHIRVHLCQLTYLQDKTHNTHHYTITKSSSSSKPSL